MTSTARPINPFYATRTARFPVPPTTRPRDPQPVYARLPQAPRNARPVPLPTSLCHSHRAGDYGGRKPTGDRSCTPTTPATGPAPPPWATSSAGTAGSTATAPAA